MHSFRDVFSTELGFECHSPPSNLLKYRKNWLYGELHFPQCITTTTQQKFRQQLFGAKVHMVLPTPRIELGTFRLQGERIDHFAKQACTTNANNNNYPLLVNFFSIPLRKCTSRSHPFGIPFIPRMWGSVLQQLTWHRGILGYKLYDCISNWSNVGAEFDKSISSGACLFFSYSAAFDALFEPWQNRNKPVSLHSRVLPRNLSASGITRIRPNQRQNSKVFTCRSPSPRSARCRYSWMRWRSSTRQARSWTGQTWDKAGKKKAEYFPARFAWTSKVHTDPLTATWSKSPFWRLLHFQY